jgi:hypothetical protein
VAVTVTSVVEELRDGAVKRPLVEIDPALARQVTAVLLVEVKVAENCCLLPEEIVAVAGEICIATLVDGTMVTSEVAMLLSSMALVAVTVTRVDDVIEGAVNNPSLETVPALARQMISEFPDSLPNFVLPVDVTVAANCCCVPELIVIFAGERLTLTLELEEVLEEFAADVGSPPQPRLRHANVARRIMVPTYQTRVAVALLRW